MAETKKPAKRKRREQFGAIRKLPSGRHQASYVGPDGVRHAAPQTFDTLTDARGWLSGQQTKIHSGTWSLADVQRGERATSSKTNTFQTYATEWIRTRTNRSGKPLAPRTIQEYERMLKVDLVDFHDRRLTAIQPAEVRTWYYGLLEAGTETLAARAYGLFRAVLNTAVADGLLQQNPCAIRGAQNASTGKDVIPPTTDELAVMRANMPPRLVAAIDIAAWGSPRYGELTELRRKDVTLIPDEHGDVEFIGIKIERAVTQVTGKGYVIGDTKSKAGKRTTILPPHINASVLHHLETYVGKHEDSLLFPASSGEKHLPESSFVKHWYKARAAADREDMPWHALRHYGATRAALVGATLKELQDRLGHSTVSAAMGYQHSAGRDAEIAKLISEAAVAPVGSTLG